MPAMFHNPYTFIPRLPRKEVLEDPDLGDAPPRVEGKPKNVAPPRWHHKLFDEQWTGTIRLRLRTETPLLICDAQETETIGGLGLDDPKAHKIYPARIDASGMPYIAPTSLKGALSTAYEIVTSSRYRVLDDWSVPLAYRPQARAANALVPVRIIEGGSTGLQAQVLKAASLRIYDPRQPDAPAARQVLRHGEHVRIRIECTPHNRVPYVLGMGVWSFDDPSAPAEALEGWVWRSGYNANNKRAERVFYVPHKESPKVLPVGIEVKRDYENLVRNYQQTHEIDLALGRTGPTTGRNLEWSRHITDKSAATLKPGDLCWAELDPENDSITALFPVTISRRLYRKAPLDLLDESLRPARELAELSPAERLFGWTAPEGKGAFRGKLRIGRVRCLAERPEDAMDSFPHPGVPLTILGQPKPQQERFYVAKDKDGTPLGKGVERGTGYGSDGSGLRGYKVYPHHRVPDGYWDDPMSDRTATVRDGWAQEYRRPGDADGRDPRDNQNQNRSVTSWVKPGVEFEVDVHVTNLTDFELGALLWLFSMEEGAHFRMGGGKPLGFGSVRIDWVPEGSTLMRGSEWRAYWRGLGKATAMALEPEKADELKDAFETRVREKFQLAQRRDADFLKAFVLVSKGFEDRLPVHYPRAVAGTQPAQQQIPQNPEGENFKWFVANERWNRNDPRQQHRYSLPHVLRDRGLPILPANAPHGGGNRGNQHHHQHGRGGRR